MGGEIDLVPRPEAFSRKPKFACPTAQVERLGETYTCQPLALAGGEKGQNVLDVALKDFQDFVGVGEHLVECAARQDIARKIHQHGFNAGPVDSHADAKRATRVELDQRSGLTALAFEPTANVFDKTGLV